MKKPQCKLHRPLPYRPFCAVKAYQNRMADLKMLRDVTLLGMTKHRADEILRHYHGENGYNRAGYDDDGRWYDSDGLYKDNNPRP